MNKRLHNQIAVVTGAGSGIGHSISLYLAEQGANIMVTDINMEAAEKTARMIKDNGGAAEAYKMDVADFKMVQDVIEKINEKYSKIDILIANAGLSTPPAFCTDMPEDHWDKLMKVHLYGAFNCVKACGDIMKANQYGRIIMMSSLAGVYGLSGNVNYAVVKTGLVGMTYTLAKEFGPFGVTVNVLQPGIIRTPMTNDALQVMEENFSKETPVGRIGKPEDVANAVSFLCSPESDFITGVVLPVDGGYILQSGMDQLMMQMCLGQ